MDSSGCVDHSQDPSHNILGLEGTDLSGVSVFELDVSGGAYITKGIVLGPSGGIWIESVSGDTHTIGSGTTGDMEMTTSNHFAVHTQKTKCFICGSGGECWYWDGGAGCGASCDGKFYGIGCEW